MNDELPDDEGRPSKSARKRAARDVQKLGEQLVGLRDAELDRLELPERLVDAIRAARRIRSRGALARQRQLIGKLMRDVDPAPIVAALAERGRLAALEAERFRHIEAWRDRLVREGEPAVDALLGWRPELDPTPLRTLLVTARDVTAPPDVRGQAGRELFRLLRASLGGT